MRKNKENGLDFIVDKLTNSIENIQTGEVFDTIIIKLTNADNSLIKTMDWRFDWSKEINDKTKKS